MSATCRSAKGRFEMFLACSSAEPSRSGAHDLMGTRPGLRTQGKASAGVDASVDPSVDVSDVMAAGPPASLGTRPTDRPVRVDGEGMTCVGQTKTGSSV